MAEQAVLSAHAGDEEAEANALHAAPDRCVELLGALGFGLHVRAARPVRARCAGARG